MDLQVVRISFHYIFWIYMGGL